MVLPKQPIVEALMTTPPTTVCSDTNLEQAMSIMILEGIHCLPVVSEDGVLVGIITDRDVRLFADSPFLEMTSVQRVSGLEAHVVSEIMQHQVLTTTPDGSVLEAARLMRHNHIGGLPVIDAQKKVMGVITRSDLIDCLMEILVRGER